MTEPKARGQGPPHAGFEASLDENPNDPSLRLVYATA
jgi:hypothetical protein